MKTTTTRSSTTSSLKSDPQHRKCSANTRSCGRTRRTPEMAKPLTDSERAARAVLAVLEQAGKIRVPSDAIKFEGSAIVLPETFAGPGGLSKAREYLAKYEQDQEKIYRKSREFHYRSWDGANAFNAAMKHVFGTAGLGVNTQPMFGSNPPQLFTVPTGVGTTTQVPWGKVALDQLDCVFTLDTTYHADFG